MKNKLVFPDGSPWSSSQRGRILDVWENIPIGLYRRDSQENYPLVTIEPYLARGHPRPDVRWIAAAPQEKRDVYELRTVDLTSLRTSNNPRVKPTEINLKRERLYLGPNKTQTARYILSTKVTPHHGAITYNLILNLPQTLLEGANEGRFWAHPDVLAQEAEWRKTPREYFGF